MKIKKVLFIKTSILLGIVIPFYSCSSTNAIDDFFGIKMYPLDEASFKIVSYSPEKGVSYLSNRKMDNRISAWAEVDVNTVKVKVLNNSDNEIPLNYNIDEYVLVTDENSYYLEKGDRQKYFEEAKIKPNSSFEITLDLPADYWKNSGTSVNYTDQAKLTKDILKDYSKTGTKLNVVKDNIKYILIKFGHNTTIILKAVPEKPKI
jgi:hypothetical protein